jgi:hypothetical protein
MPQMDCATDLRGFVQMESLGHEQNTLIPRAVKGSKVIYFQIKVRF